MEQQFERVFMRKACTVVMASGAAVQYSPGHAYNVPSQDVAELVAKGIALAPADAPVAGSEALPQAETVAVPVSVVSPAPTSAEPLQTPAVQS